MEQRRGRLPRLKGQKLSAQINGGPVYALMGFLFSRGNAGANDTLRRRHGGGLVFLSVALSRLVATGNDVGSSSTPK